MGYLKASIQVTRLTDKDTHPMEIEENNVIKDIEAEANIKIPPHVH